MRGRAFTGADVRGSVAVMSPAPPSLKRRASPRLIALIVASGLFMEQLDGTVLATALPDMAASLGADVLHMSTALTAYLLSLAVFIPVSGQVADRFGSRTVFCGAIMLFMAGSILCAQAWSLESLVVARIVQGIGGALMVPVGRLVMLRSVSKQDLIDATAWMLVPGMAGPVLGPPVGGWITTHLSWRWIFYINIPVGVVGLVAVLIFIENFRAPAPRFDWRGIMLSGAALCLLMLGLETGSRGQLSVGWTALVLGAGVAAAIAYLLHARVSPRPVLDPALMKVQTFAVSVISGTLFRVGFGSLPFLLPMLMQIGFGVSAEKSGFITFAAAGGAVLMKATAGPCLRRLGFRRTFVWVGLISGLLLAACGLIRPGWPAPVIYTLLLLCGFISSLQFTGYNTIAYCDLKPAQMSSGASFYATFQQFALTLGIAVAAAGLSALTALRGQALPDFADFTLVFGLMGAIAGSSALIATSLPRNAGADVSGKDS